MSLEHEPSSEPRHNSLRTSVAQSSLKTIHHFLLAGVARAHTFRKATRLHPISEFVKYLSSILHSEFLQVIAQLGCAGTAHPIAPHIPHTQLRAGLMDQIGCSGWRWVDTSGVVEMATRASGETHTSCRSAFDACSVLYVPAFREFCENCLFLEFSEKLFQECENHTSCRSAVDACFVSYVPAGRK